MTFSVLITYFMVIFVLSLTPGPNMLLSMAHGVRYGVKKTIATMTGLLLGSCILLTISICGVGAILMTSAILFTIIKLTGAAYLIWLGITTWRNSEKSIGTSKLATRLVDSNWNRFYSGLTVALFNPKAIAFGMALFPQFINQSQPVLNQSIILISVFIIIETFWMTVYASSGAKIAVWLRHGRHLCWFNRTIAVIFISLGGGLSMLQR